MFIGQPKDKINLDVKMIARFYIPSPFGYRQEQTVYKFSDDNGNILCWKTSGVINTDKCDNYNERRGLRIGDKLNISAVVKDHYTYKQEDTTSIIRVKCNHVIEEALSKAERDEIKRNEQLATLKDGDFLYPMPYKQYKEHYSDCETLAGTYKDKDDMGRMIYATITVIIREGRLKNSGTRFQHYSGYQFTNENGKYITYRAVSEENAKKRCEKENPNHTWKCTKIYNYRRMSGRLSW